jgi:hypothetical protein
MLSPTQLVVQRYQLESELKEAQQSGDIPTIQKALRQLTKFMQAYYGKPARA